ncbi:MAG: hypothetical protein ABIU77_10565, partial [Ferruginibacter sp.]
MTKNYWYIFKMTQLFSLKAAALPGLILLMNIFLFNSVYAQQAGKDLIEAKFEAWRQNNLQEKIYLHTDKANYVTGEICWFKIYNVNAYNHQPIDFGKVAYVEVLDRNNQAVLQAKIGLGKGVGNGSFYLPATLTTGNYKIRAYTNWMKNNGADYFFEKKLVIINVQKNTSASATAEKSLYDIGFFPEGGNLVNGIESKVGFKVNNQWGKGVEFEGLLLNEKGDTITRFHPLKFGMGSFIFTPLAGAQYRAVVKLPGGEEQVKTLSAPYNIGYSMRLQPGVNGKLTIKVNTNEPANGYPVFLFVHTRNVVKVFSTAVIQNGQAEFVTDSRQLEDGISQFTIFNSGRQPICERLYFKPPQHALRITTIADQAQYGLRKKINIEINSAKQQAEAVAANMSMAVFRVDDFTQPDIAGIDNYLLLQSDIVGQVESPAYYFTINDDTVATAADNLMLTQGWRRFRWNDVMQDKKSAVQFLPEMYGHVIS